MNNIKSVLELAWNSNNRFLVFGLILCIVALIVAVAIIFIKKIHLKDVIARTKSAVLISYKRLDDRAKSQLMSRLQMSSESEFSVNLSFYEKMDLRLIARSNVRSFIPFLNVYVLIIIFVVVFFVLLAPVYHLFNSWKTAVVVSVFLSLIPSIVLDFMAVYYSSKTRKTTASFLSLLASWLEVKNDIVFAFENVLEDVEVPLSFYLADSLAQLKSGVDPEQVFDVLSFKVNTNQFYIISKNLKSVLKNGGDVVGLVKILEEEAYKVDNEFETRVTDTFMTRLLLNLLLLGAALFLVGALLFDPTLKELYTNTVGGKNVMFFASLVFICGFAWNLKSGSPEY